ncbi:MAG: calcium:proton antiporter [Alkalilacustris sp.]
MPRPSPNRASQRAAPAAPLWTILVPLGALVFVAAVMLALPDGVPGWLVPVAVPLLLATVFAAVHHAETIAHRLGDPYGAILLALAVTIIEVALIVSVLLGAPPGESAIARDTVFAAIMIVLNGIVGLCLLVGGIRHHEQGFQARGATGALAVLGTVAVLALVLPNYTLAVPGPVYAPPQLLFVAATSLALYGLFLFVQMVRHRDDFRDARPEEADPAHGGAPPDRRAMTAALVLLPLALLAVVGLAESLAPTVEHAVARAGLPAALVGVTIAMTVLLPEGTAALRAARANRIQTSLNLALGSALASICLTIPTVAVLSVILGQPLILGLEAEHIVLLVLSLFMATLSLAMGRTTILQGGVHLVIFGAFLTLAAMP